MEWKRILCPTDFSDPAYEALKAAAGLAMDYAAELLVMHVVESLPAVPLSLEDPQPAYYIQEYEKEMEAAARKRLEGLVKRVIFAKIRVRPLVRTGQPAVQIVELAEKNRTDLIVIATHGLTGWRQFFFGSVTERVIKLATKPVLIIQTKPPARTRKKEGG